MGGVIRYLQDFWILYLDCRIKYRIILLNVFYYNLTLFLRRAKCLVYHLRKRKLKEYLSLVQNQILNSQRKNQSCLKNQYQAGSLT
jgi:hypothetical protein